MKATLIDSSSIWLAKFASNMIQDIGRKVVQQSWITGGNINCIAIMQVTWPMLYARYPFAENISQGILTQVLKGSHIRMSNYSMFVTLECWRYNTKLLYWIFCLFLTHFQVPLIHLNNYITLVMWLPPGKWKYERQFL